MKKFEYKTEKVEIKESFWGNIKTDETGMEGLLNSFGADGWELVSCTALQKVYGVSRYLLLAFKREIEE